MKNNYTYCKVLRKMVFLYRTTQLVLIGQKGLRYNLFPPLVRSNIHQHVKKAA